MYLFHIFRSFVPLRNPLGFGVSDLLELGMALVALIGIFGHAYFGIVLKNAARRTASCMLALFILPIALRLALLPRAPLPVATTADEFSSLLLSDTLAHGRLVNPAHSLHEFFETPLVVQEPTYRSRLPLADGLLPAAGQFLFRSNWAGILLGIGALSALTYWMLRGWTTPDWALYGGVLAACAFGPLCRWANSYWGGFIAAVAGCMILGALPRLRRHKNARDFALLGIGLAVELLANPAAFCLFAPLLVLIAAAVLKRLKQFRPTLVFIVLLMYGTHFVFWYGMHALADGATLSAAAAYGGRDFLSNRGAQIHRTVDEELERESGRELVFVRRDPWHATGEWVHNRADIDASRIVWARDLGDSSNRKLLDYYRGRKAWLLEPDAIPPRLRAYNAGAAVFENAQ